MELRQGMAGNRPGASRERQGDKGWSSARWKIREELDLFAVSLHLLFFQFSSWFVKSLSGSLCNDWTGSMQKETRSKTNLEPDLGCDG